jgi:hypothetical protein
MFFHKRKKEHRDVYLKKEKYSTVHLHWDDENKYYLTKKILIIIMNTLFKRLLLVI